MMERKTVMELCEMMGDQIAMQGDDEELCDALHEIASQIRDTLES